MYARQTFAQQTQQLCFSYLDLELAPPCVIDYLLNTERQRPPKGQEVLWSRPHSRYSAERAGGSHSDPGRLSSPLGL
ncbi:hypothetical protein H8959_008188 [Pygathrix nigripes]